MEIVIGSLVAWVAVGSITAMFLNFLRRFDWALLLPKREIIDSELTPSQVCAQRMACLNRHLNRQGRSRPAVDQTVACLQNLASTPDTVLLDLLLRSASVVAHPRIRLAAFHALGTGSAYYESAWVPLAAYSRESQSPRRVAWMAVWALRRVLLDHPEHLPAIATDPSPRVRAATIDCALQVLDGSSDADSQRQTLILLAIVKRGSRDANAQVRRKALRGLVQNSCLYDPKWTALALRDVEPEVQLAAVEALRQKWFSGRCKEQDVGPWTAQAELLMARRQNATPRLRNAIAQALGDIPEPQREDIVLHFLRRSRQAESATPNWILRGLGLFDRPENAACLLELLVGDEPVARQQAAKGLACLARTIFPKRFDETTTAQLGGLLRREKDPLVILAVSQALVYGGDREATDRLMAKIPTVDSALRRRLLEGIATIHGLAKFQPRSQSHSRKGSRSA